LGGSITSDHHFESQRSTIFDAVFIPSGAELSKTLAFNGRVVRVREAFGHCKAIGAIGEAVKPPNVKLFPPAAASNNVVTSYSIVTTGKYTVTSAARDTLKKLDPD